MVSSHHFTEPKGRFDLPAMKFAVLNEIASLGQRLSRSPSQRQRRPPSIRPDVVGPLASFGYTLLRPAIIFGILYAVILFIVAWAKSQFGSQALYGVAMISGLTDVDAITLSTANLFNDDRVSAGVAWRVILIATLSNLAFKGGAVMLLGSRRLLIYVAVLFGIALAGGIALLFLWPDIAIEFPSSVIIAPAESK